MNCNGGLEVTREELAAHFLFAYIAKDEIVSYERCFQMADNFLAYAKEQREPKACEHHRGGTWVNCLRCGAPMDEPEPPKPERVAAREWDATVSPNGWVIDNRFHFNSEATGMKVIRVREILPGDDK